MFRVKSGLFQQLLARHPSGCLAFFTPPPKQSWRVLRRVLLGILVAFLCIPTGAAEPDPTVDLELPSTWVKSFDARLWAGYKDNVLLARQNTIGSPFIAGGLDVALMRLPIDGWEWLLLATGDYLRYLDAPSVEQEATAILSAQFKKSLGSGWKAGAAAEYVYFNQVFDATILEDQPSPLLVIGHALTLRPLVTKALHGRSRLELEMPASRQFFEQEIDNYWEFGPKLTYGREIGAGAEMTASYQFNDRLHDTREAREASGASIPGRLLEFQQHEMEAGWRQFWDEPRRWRSLLKLSLQRNNDNGGGYYDYWRPSLSGQLRYQAPRWEIRADARVSRYSYDRQHIDEPDSPIRERTYLRLGLRAERTVIKSLRLFVQYEYEQTLSNLQLDEYIVNMASAGVDWEF